MKKFIAIFILALVIPIGAQQNTTRFFFAYDYENLTVDNTAGGVAFTASKVTPAGQIYRAELVTFRVVCASSPCNSRIMTDGATTVTSSVGQLVQEGDYVSIFGYQNIVNFRAIRTGANSATYNVVFNR